MILLFKEPEKQRELEKLHHKLQLVLFDFAEMVYTRYQRPIVITSMIRKDDTTSVHAWGRGVDVALIPDADNEALRKEVNEVFKYGDDEHDTCPPLDHGSAPHFHFQCRTEA
jgi:hypothetical protein